MALAISLVLAAGGAILIWGVNAEVAGVDLEVIGWTGIVVGAVGALLALLAHALRTLNDRFRRSDYTIER